MDRQGEDYTSVTEIAGDDVSREQVARLCNRYFWAGGYCSQKDVLEVACGTGQGLGYLSGIAQSIEAGDYSRGIVELARSHYQGRIPIHQFDAQKMPFENSSKDVIILFEAIYYLPDPEKFLKECIRVLRDEGTILVATANKDLYDFNPSPKSHEYFGVPELSAVFDKYDLDVRFYGDTPVERTSLRQRLVRPVKRTVVRFGLMPKSMAGKKRLKRLVFGSLVKMPSEIDKSTSPYIPPAEISASVPDRKHKVILCAARMK